MKRKLTILIFFCLGAIFATAQQVNIGLWQDHRSTKKFSYRAQHLSTWTGDGKTIKIPANKSLYFTYESGAIRMSTADKVLGHYKKIVSLSTGNYNLKSLAPSRREEIYIADLSITVVGKGLRLINKFSDIENYISGVVEAESGKEQNEEYYKVQATICRTFAMSNSRRHEHEGFNLCDQQHCQVYHGISRFNPLIIETTLKTAGEVIVDSDINLITASFHSNCGGITTNSEDVWTLALPYLRSVTDTFCLAGKHAYWEREISKDKWINYMKKKYPMDFSNSDMKGLLECSSEDRERYISLSKQNIERKDIRHNWKLKSTFFDFYTDANTVTLCGRGHGHGVGLCQEGAMEMSRSGYAYLDILRYYYTDVHLIHKSMKDFFKQD